MVGYSASMKQKDISTLLHEINSPLASMQAILFTLPIDKKIQSRLTHHIHRLSQASQVLSEYLSPQNATKDTLERLLSIYTKSPPQIINNIYTWPKNSSTSSTQFDQVLWQLITKIADSLDIRLKQEPDLICLDLKHVAKSSNRM